ncbi:MAG TPA: glutathione S-transferase [Geminicoccus sp.]|uniref:glutathione S-transferase n=1 Tax=Geminicoccus sp. TaxID=2024832 RepID=UPI002B7A7F2A|nr:glutathione S-transferase [Geminicoccus sp.]HWL69235.1 glutathione S-transferase [Geminicoccus sp.]
MYELWIANKNFSSWSLRPWVLMRGLGIEFEERQVEFGPGSNWPAFRAFSPTGQVPALRDGDLTVWESLAIVEYLAERHEGIWPGEAKARAWARSAAAEMHAGFAELRSRCPMSVGHRVELAQRPPELERDLARLDELWNEGIHRFGGPFLAGAAFTAVDAFFAPVAFRAQTYGLRFTGAAASYPAHLLELPAMRAWAEEALAEPWREPGHEAQVAATGTITADLRASV